MTSVAVLLVSSALGVNWGWQPVAGGGFEYIIRIEPHLLDSLKDGHDIFSDLPPELREVRAYRVTVSDTPVPHEGETPPVAAKAERPTLPPDEPAPVAPSEPPRLLETPKPEPSAPVTDPMVKQAGGPMAAASQATEKAEPAEKPTSESKPWAVLTAVALGLFASIGLNVFLGWINRDLRIRYRGLLDQLRPSRPGPAPA